MAIRQADDELAITQRRPGSDWLPAWPDDAGESHRLPAGRTRHDGWFGRRYSGQVHTQCKL